MLHSDDYPYNFTSILSFVLVLQYEIIYMKILYKVYDPIVILFFTILLDGNSINI